MGAETKIAWCHATFSPWLGCAHKLTPDGTEHPGCANCYAENMLDSRFGKVKWGPEGTRVMTAPDAWQKVRGWNARAAKKGERIRVFPSVCDPFEDWQDPVRNMKGGELSIRADGFIWSSATSGTIDDDWGVRPLTMTDLRANFFRLLDETPSIDWLLLTKRPENIPAMWPTTMRNVIHGNAPPVMALERERRRLANAWLLYSASDQASLDAGIEPLLAGRNLCPVLGLSLEPLLGPVAVPLCFHESSDLNQTDHSECAPMVNWVIVGCESRGSRVGRLPDGGEKEWCAIALDVVKQCEAAGVPCWVKQVPIGGKVVKDMDRFPPGLQFQQFPDGAGI